MPQMNGKELAERLRQVCPEVKALFISRYSGTTLEHRGMFEQDIDFMQKPFTSQEFLAKIRKILGRKEAFVAPSSVFPSLSK